MMRNWKLYVNGLAAVVMSWFLCFLAFQPAYSATLEQEPLPTPTLVPTEETQVEANLSIPDETCLSCHGQPGSTFELENGEILNLYVPAELHASSIHGELGYACVQCHADVGEYPHPPFEASDLRDVTLQLSTVCQRCHSAQYELTADSVHAAAQQAGNRAAAVCSDCHGAHDVRQLTDPKTGELTPEGRLWIPQTCAQCHSAIYEKYQDSVHGSALIGEGNPDVPTCIDCHGVHNIEDPTTAAFRLNSPQICAKCHTDPKIMNKYGISTDVLNTYIADFHGTSVVLFEPRTPDQQVNKPVCYDCHGVHDIAAAEDPQKGLQVRQNLLARCQVCHPDATINFPDAWLSHYIPSPDHNPLVYYVNLFYKILIPGLIGGMVVLVSLDTGRNLLNRYRRRKSNQAVNIIAAEPEGLQKQDSDETDSELPHE